MQDSESDNDVPVRQRAPQKGRRPGAAASANPEECKQQWAGGG